MTQGRKGRTNGRAREEDGIPALPARLVVWLGDRRYAGRPHEIVGKWREESLVTEAGSLAEYFAEVREWTFRLTGKRIVAVRTARELIDELVRVGVARIEREGRNR